MQSLRRIHLLPVVAALQAAYPLAHAADFTAGNGSTLGAQTLTGNTGTVATGGTVTTSGSTAAVTINAGTSSLSNSGTISQTGTGIAVDNNTAGAAFTLTNNDNALINAAGAVTVRINKATDSFHIVNLGTISQTGSVTDGKSYAIKTNVDFTTTGNTIVNGSATDRDAIITSSSASAMKLGSNTLLTNYGSIYTTSPVNTKCADYITACGTGSPPKAADGVSIDDAMKNTVILNHGSITGARHGVDGGNPVSTTADANLIGTAQLVAHVTSSGVTFDRTDLAGTTTTGVTISNPLIINYADGVITGNNGSGVGLDGHGIVFNYGTITGNYAGAGRVYDQLGLGLTTSNGDGDGVDIDGVAYVENWGTIKGTGAGGLDSTALPNGADGIAAGGGTFINHAGATIYGENHGILIDDGADGTTTTVRGTSTAAGSAAYIVNDGTITGQKGIAIGLVGNFADTLINNAGGVIVGGTNATLVGANNSTNAGAAVQMGDGNDTLINYGRIEGKNGLAIDMGNGDDSLQLLGGTVIGTINGGAGTDTLTTGGTQTFASGVLSGFENFAVHDGVTTFNYDLGTVTGMTVNNGATLQINGDFGTSGDLAVDGTLKAASGTQTRTINVGGNFSLGSTATLQIGIANTQADQINVTGTASLANGATVQPIARTYVPASASWTIVSAAGGLTANASQLQVSDTATLDYALQTSGNNLILTAQRTGTASSITHGSGIGQALDSLVANGGSAQSLSVLATLDAQPTADAYRAAVKQLQPETNHASQQAAQTAMGSVFNAVGDRIDVARNGGNFASNGSSGISTGDAATRGRMWLQGLGAWGKQDARAGADGYRINAYGMAGGLETDLSAREVAGVTVGYTRAGTRGSDTATGNDVDVDAFNIGGYMGRDMGGWTLDTSLMLGRNHYSSTRAVNFVGETVHGSYDGWQIGARVEAGLPFTIDKTWSGRWLAGLRASHLDNQSYTENGDAAVAQNVASTSANSVQPTLGVEFNRVGENGGRLQLRARYLHELASDPSVTASFVAGGPSFVTPGASQNRDALQLGTSYRWNSANGSFATMGYDAEVRDRSLVNQVTARLGWLF